MSETNELIKRRTSELTEQTSPSTSAKLVGVDNGETVQVPTSFFQEQIDELKKDVEGKAESTHGHSYNDLTDKPTIPSVVGLASETYVNEKVAGVVNSAPATLDTLNELSKALGNDPNFATSVATQIGNKVDKVSGKGLSENDYTTTEKNKLAGIASGANAYTHPISHPANMIEGLAKVATSGSYNDLTDKPTIPSTEGLATEKYVDEKVSSMSGGSSSGGGASIIYATELPSTPAQAIYVVTQDEVVKVELYSDGVNITPDGGYCEIVDELPENPEPVIKVAADMSVEYMYTYYHAKENEGYVYIDETAASLSEAPTGWLPASAMGAVISTSVDDMTESGQGLLLTKQPKTRVYVPMQDGTFLELTSGIRTRFDEHSRVVSITENGRW